MGKQKEMKDGSKAKKSSNKIADYFDIVNMTKISNKIKSSIIIVSVGSMIVLGALGVITNYINASSLQEEILSEVAALSGEKASWRLEALRNVVEDIGTISEVTNANLDTDTVQSILNSKLEQYPEYNFIRSKFIGLDGIAPIDGTDYSEREYFKIASKGESYISEPLVAKTDGKISFIIAAPVHDQGIPTNPVAGVVFASIDPGELDEIVAEAKELSKHADAYILDADGTVVCSTVEDYKTAETNFIELAKTDKSFKARAKVAEKMMSGSAGYTHYRKGLKTYYVGYAPIASSGWSIAIGAPSSDFMGTTYAVIILTLVVLVIAVIAARKFATKVGDNIGGPIAQCAERIKLLGEGDLTSPMPEIDTKDETRELVDTTGKIVSHLNYLIKDLTRILDTMADGNFNVDSEDRSIYKGDFDPILKALSYIKHALIDTLSAISDAVVQVSAGSENMAEGAQNLAEGATDQSAAVEELLATVNDTLETVKTNAQIAVDTSNTAKRIGSEAAASSEKVYEATNAMQRIAESSAQIGNIIQTIESIADQTSLLSLNAAIEAARAGEAGRGFAVVADEISQLANQSAIAAGDTRKLIEDSLAEVEKGNKVVDETSVSMQHVITGIEDIVQQIAKVAQASEQQAEIMSQLNDGIEQISAVVETNSATAEESSATSQELSAQAEQLRNQVEQFTF